MVPSPDDLGTMFADRTKVRRALFNLLSTAAKFTDDGTINLTVSRGASPPGDDTVTFAVADTGIGMTEEQLGRVTSAPGQGATFTILLPAVVADPEPPAVQTAD